MGQAAPCDTWWNPCKNPWLANMDLWCFFLRPHFLQWIKLWFGARFGDLVFAQLLFMTVSANRRTLEQLWNHSTKIQQISTDLNTQNAMCTNMIKHDSFCGNKRRTTLTAVSDRTLWQTCSPVKESAAHLPPMLTAFPPFWGGGPSLWPQEMGGAGRCFEQSLNCQG